MNPLTLEWIEKAEGDLITSQREYRARNNPNYTATCFHAQQTVELVITHKSSPEKGKGANQQRIRS
jgi:HEPN domain-containing protein